MSVNTSDEKVEKVTQGWQAPQGVRRPITAACNKRSYPHDAPASPAYTKVLPLDLKKYMSASETVDFLEEVENNLEELSTYRFGAHWDKMKSVKGNPDIERAMIENERLRVLHKKKRLALLQEMVNWYKKEAFTEEHLEPHSHDTGPYTPQSPPPVPESASLEWPSEVPSEVPSEASSFGPVFPGYYENAMVGIHQGNVNDSLKELKKNLKLFEAAVNELSVHSEAQTMAAAAAAKRKRTE